MATAQPDDSPESYIEVAATYRQIMIEQRGIYDRTAADYRNAVARALEAGASARQLAARLGIARSSVYDVARRAEQRGT